VLAAKVALYKADAGAGWGAGGFASDSKAGDRDGDAITFDLG
jgi:hypothetical protein